MAVPNTREIRVRQPSLRLADPTNIATPQLATHREILAAATVPPVMPNGGSSNSLPLGPTVPAPLPSAPCRVDNPTTASQTPVEPASNKRKTPGKWPGDGDELDANGQYKDVEVMEIIDSDSEKTVNKDPKKDFDHFFEAPKAPTAGDKNSRHICKLCSHRRFRTVLTSVTTDLIGNANGTGTDSYSQGSQAQLQPHTSLDESNLNLNDMDELEDPNKRHRIGLEDHDTPPPPPNVDNIDTGGNNTPPAGVAEEEHDKEEDLPLPVPTAHRHPEFAINDAFVPRTEELRITLEFKKSIENASLNNGDLDAEQLCTLRFPPQHVPALDNHHILLSLKLFVSTTIAANQVYTNVRAHAAIKKLVAQMSGVTPIVKDMCPNSCIAYTGPYSDLTACPYPDCRTSRMDPLQQTKLPSNIFIPSHLAHSCNPFTAHLKEHTTWVIGHVAPKSL
ncbi:hypothetical protein DXG01_013440 [Tephrocybe rancida]|nr:hypothetical protein DXG01_013440 [Tephrocybe rancida]